MLTIRMRVHLYLPAKLYGFCQGDDGVMVFFHAKSFSPGIHLEIQPPPIIGEFVDVTYEPDAQGGRAPQAVSVLRTSPPVVLEGVVESFDANQGWGFLQGSDMVSYFLHRCEILGKRIPFVADKVRFHAGWKNGRPRACYVHILR